jgi:hypothetical protein
MDGDDNSQTELNRKIMFSMVYKAIPCYVTIFLALIRYLAIRNDAITGDISYSRLMKAKLITSYMFGFIYIIPIPLISVESFWLHRHPYY